jgi:hypothetical protein
MAYNSVRLEAVLVNPVAELPEIVRLGWLLSQLNSDLPVFQGELTRAQVERAARLALVPVALAAAAEVELAACDPATLARALDVWGLSDVRPPLQAPAEGRSGEGQGESQLRSPLPPGEGEGEGNDKFASQAPMDSAPSAALADTLWRWWDTYATSRPPWHVALAALDRMVSE